MDINILRLIKNVNDNYAHIYNLEALVDLLCGKEEELLIVRTTHNSHYNYKLYTNPIYQNPDNHVDVVLKEKSPTGFDYMEQYKFKSKYYEIMQG